jgi:hypothetical protein
MNSGNIQSRKAEVSRPASQCSGSTTDGPGVLSSSTRDITMVAPNLHIHVPGKDRASGEEEESQAARIERLGRERPKEFKTIWAEIGFIFSIAMSQVLTVKAPYLSCITSHLSRRSGC